MKNKLDSSPALDLEPAAPGEHAPVLRQDSASAVQSAPPHPLVLLERAMQAGLTSENVAVAEKLLAMARDQRAEDAKAAFAKAFFKLRQNMPTLHADKQARNKAGEVTFVYCSEEEISKMLEPHLMNYGFAMLFGQSENNGRITVNVTLMHEKGHSETREYTVRAGSPNAMKDAAMCDAGGATTAWRHLVSKIFGLKSRIQENQDNRNEGEKIPPEKVQYLVEQVRELGGSAESNLLELAGVAKFEDVAELVYPVLIRMIEGRKRAKKVSP